jgi:uncharacterized membrane protein YjgN (DUF898 family)
MSNPSYGRRRSESIMGERVASLIGLLLIFYMISETFIGGWLIWKSYGFSALWTSLESVPYYFTSSFFTWIIHVDTIY